MQLKHLNLIFNILKEQDLGFPIVTEIYDLYKTPFSVLISCLLSLRTKDPITKDASLRLFKLADTPQKMIKLDIAKIKKTIYPVGFYNIKAEQIIAISKKIIQDYQGLVPDEIEKLLKFKGVGRKTANLVLTVAFKKPGICVDTHVHRICNRWGLVKTLNPNQTEVELRLILPKKYWLIINDLLVVFGQNICKPISPHCSICKIKQFCPQNNVLKSR